jgi:hypothetical protein
MAKSGHTSAKSGRSSGKKLGDPDDPLYDELTSIGKRRHPLDSAAFIERGCPQLLACPAVEKRAGQGASTHQLAEAACEVLRKIILALKDETKRQIAEAAFAVDEDYQGKLIYERQKLLTQKHYISENVYAERRPKYSARLFSPYGEKLIQTRPHRVIPHSLGQCTFLRLLHVPRSSISRVSRQPLSTRSYRDSNVIARPASSGIVQNSTNAT